MTRPAGIVADMLRTAFVAAALALCAGPSAAQRIRPPDLSADPAAAEARADSGAPGLLLGVTSDPPGARVYRDTLLLGVTPLLVPVSGSPADEGEGIVRLTILGGDPGSWFVPIVSDSVRIRARGGPPGGGADTIRRHYVLPLTARITSDPPEAEVMLGDSLLGRTPLFVSIPGGGGAVSVRKEGFLTKTVLLGAGAAQFHAELDPAGPSGRPEPTPLAEVSGKGRTMLFVAAGTAVVTGAAAAWLKNRADNSYEDYRSGGDPAALDRVRRYDLLSGIALSVAEISLGYLIIELLSR